MRATDYIREKRRRPDTNAICDHLKKIETSNIDKETIGNIIPELINQKISKNKKSVYEDSFRLMTGKEKETDKTTLRKMITNLILVSTLISSHFTYRNEQDIIQEISPIRKPVINPDIHNLLLQPIRETELVINPDLPKLVIDTLPSNKKDHFQHNQQRIINRFEAKISALKSHLKCKVSTMNCKIDLLSELIENKVNVLSDQCNEMLEDDIKFLQMELKTKNEIINYL